MIIIYQHLLECLRNVKATLHESIKVTSFYSDSTMSLVVKVRKLVYFYKDLESMAQCLSVPYFSLIF